MKKALKYLPLVLAFLLASCATYTTPGGPADLSGITDVDIAESYKARPAAKTPSRIAFVRVQQSGYRSNTAEGKGSGAYSVVSTPDIETAADLDRIQSLPRVAGAARLNSLLLPKNLHSFKDIRVAAAKLQTDFVFLYTLDTQFRTDDKLAPLSVVSLGLSPNQLFQVTSTASAILLDTRTGYIYGAIEEQSVSSKYTSGWGVLLSMDQTRLDTERKALDKLLVSFEKMWRRGVR